MPISFSFNFRKKELNKEMKISSAPPPPPFKKTQKKGKKERKRTSHRIPHQDPNIFFEVWI